MSTREEQKEQRRMEILYAGLELFVKKGYAATKISDIADKAKMSVGLLFHYFKSKENLYEELVKMGLHGTQIPLQMESKEPIMFFEGFIGELFKSMKEEPWISKMFVLMAQAQRSDGTPDSVRKITTQVDTIEKSVKIVKTGQRNGTIREGDPLAISNAFWCSIQGIAEQFALNPDIPLPEVEWVVDIIRRKEVK